MGGLEGAAALVTGASRGVGRALARALAEDGVDLVVSSRGGRGLREVAEATGGHAVEADLERLSDVDRLVEAARQRLGRAPDILVSAAACFDLAPVAQLPLADFERHLRVNLRAPVALVRALLPDMLVRGSGQLVQVGPAAGRRGGPGSAAYTACVDGLRGFHRVLRRELAGTGVRAILVDPRPSPALAAETVLARLRPARRGVRGTRPFGSPELLDSSCSSS